MAASVHHGAPAAGASKAAKATSATSAGAQRAHQVIRTRSRRRFDPTRSALLLRFILLNLLALAMLGAAWTQGYVNTIVTADQTYLSVVIFVVFAVGLGISAWRAWQISDEIDALKRRDTSVPLSPAAVQAVRGSLGGMRIRVSQRISAVRHIGNTLVLLGLIGTVLGFIIALSGVEPDGVADVSAIAPMVSTLISGMSTALYTTLVGSVLNVWLMANYQILSGGTMHLMSLLLDKVPGNA